MKTFFTQDIDEEELSKRDLKELLSFACECYVPPNLPIDLRTKLTVALIHVRAFELAAPLVELLMR